VKTGWRSDSGGGFLTIRCNRSHEPQTLVLNVVGLTPALLAHAPNLSALAKRGGMRPLDTVVRR